MRKVIVFTNLTLDGVKQAPGRREEDLRGGFSYGGWRAPYPAMSFTPGADKSNIPYQEIFVIQEGSATYTVGPVSLAAHAGQIVIVPAGTPHRFVNSGNCALRQVDIHLSRQFITEWLEDEF